MGTRQPQPGLPALSKTFHIPAIMAMQAAITMMVQINETVSSIVLLFEVLRRSPAVQAGAGQIFVSGRLQKFGDAPASSKKKDGRWLGMRGRRQFTRAYF